MTDQQLIPQLKKLYTASSKHSAYQTLHPKLSNLLGGIDHKNKTKFDRERLDYFLREFDLQDRSALDIGGNTGYFTFKLVDAGASRVDFYEGNQEHARFVELSSRILKLDHQINVHPQYFLFGETSADDDYYLILLLNVLHHLGDDYGEIGDSIQDAKDLMLQQLNSLSDKTSYLVLQLGFNWQGNIHKPLFQNGTKREMINFVRKGVKDFWSIRKIGIAQRNRSRVYYEDLSDNNIERDDSLGEFLNRPIFILESKKQTRP